MSVFPSEVTIIAGGKKIPGWKSYDISCDVLQPADSFDLGVQFSRDAWDLLVPDVEVAIYIDSVRIITGFIGTREKTSSGGGTILRVSGRDKTGRLVDESAPLLKYGGLHIKDLAEKICGIGTANSIFDRVVLVNTRNRSLLRNRRAAKAKAFREPVTASGNFRSPAGVRVGSVQKKPVIVPGIFSGRSSPKRVNPGQSRWSVLEEFLREARLIAWSSADGKELFVGLPNYDQEAQYLFYEAAGNSENRDQTNSSISVSENIEEMYSVIVALGASRGSGSSYGKHTIKNRAAVYDNPSNRNDGTGALFTRRKALIITDDGIRTQRQALERAEREQLERASSHLEIQVDAAGHSQLYKGEIPAVFTVDTMAKVIDEDTGVKGDFYITACNYSRDIGGTRTSVTLVPKGTLLAS